MPCTTVNLLSQEEIDFIYFIDLIGGLLQQDGIESVTELLQYKYPRSYSRLCEVIVKQFCKQYKVKLVCDRPDSGKYHET